MAGTIRRRVCDPCWVIETINPLCLGRLHGDVRNGGKSQGGSAHLPGRDTRHPDLDARVVCDNQLQGNPPLPGVLAKLRMKQSPDKSSRRWVAWVYLAPLVLIFPWYWPANDVRQEALGYSLWSLASLGALFATSLLTAWIYWTGDASD